MRNWVKGLGVTLLVSAVACSSSSGGGSVTRVAGNKMLMTSDDRGYRADLHGYAQLRESQHLESGCVQAGRVHGGGGGAGVQLVRSTRTTRPAVSQPAARVRPCHRQYVDVGDCTVDGLRRRHGRGAFAAVPTCASCGVDRTDGGTGEPRRPPRAAPR